MDEPQQVSPVDDLIYWDLPEAFDFQIDGSSATPSPSNELNYAHMFIFLKKWIDMNTKQIDKLRSENAALLFAINELIVSNVAVKQTPIAEPRRVTPITPKNLFNTNLISVGDRLTKQQGKHPMAKINPVGPSPGYEQQPRKSLDGDPSLPGDIQQRLEIRSQSSRL